MKKVIALLLALALTLSCAAVLAENTDEKTEMGTIDFGGRFIIKGRIPEGYTLIEEEKQDQVFINATLKKENDPTAPYLTIKVYLKDTFKNPHTRMNDLSEEELKYYEDTFTKDADVKIEYTETGLGTKLMQITEIGVDTDWIAFFSIYEGYEIELTVHASELAETRELSDEVIAKAIQFLTDMDFINVEEEKPAE